MSSQPWPRSSWGFRPYWARTSQSSSFSLVFYICLFAGVCVEEGWQGSHHGAFAQGQVSLPLSLLFLTFVCFLVYVCVCVEEGWQGSHHGAFAHTGQGQVSLPLSFFFLHFFCLFAGVCVWRGGCKAVIVGLSPMLSSFSFVFYISFVRLMVCVWRGVGKAGSNHGSFAHTG